MSLLNDVLRDLDARRADATAGADLQREIRSLPVVRERPRWLPWMLVAAILASAGAAVLWMERGAGGAVPRGDERASEQRAAAPAAPPSANVPASAASPASETPVASVAAAAAQPLADPGEPALRAALQLDRLPRQEIAAARPAVRPRVEPAAKARTEPSAEPVAAKAEPAAASTPLAAPPKARPEVADGTPKNTDSKSPGLVEKKPVLATPRDRADAELHIAQSLLAQGRVNDAVESLRAALRHDPGHSTARQLWLKVLLEGKRNDEAVAVLQEGLEAQANQTGWAMTLARLLVEKNDLAAAERVLGRSWPYGASNPAYAGFYGHVRSRLGQHKDAVELYQVATRLAPAEGRWWFGLASSLEGAGRAGEAREAYRQAQQSGNLPAELTAIAEQRLAR